VPDGVITSTGAKALEEAFGQEHERTYGHRAGAEEPVELVSLQLVARALEAGPAAPLSADRLIRQEVRPNPETRQAYFGPERGWLETPVVRRDALAEARMGPCIIEEYDATCLVPPGTRAALDALANIILDL
jgi:N-methylhydantoinase A